MSTARHFPGCGVVSDNGVPKSVVVVGGGNTDTSVAFDTAEILDLATLTWKPAKQAYPLRLLYSTVVQRGDAFLVVGGKNATSNHDAVYEFDPATEGWTLMPQRMVQHKHRVAALIVGPQDFPKCS